MLLSKSYDVLTSIHLKLVFDDESVKDNIVSLNDIINVVYNKDGRRRTMEGYVTRICVDNICQKRSWYIIVDASTYGRNNVDRILIENIIDLDIIKKSSELITVSTPIDETKVTNIRFIDNIFQISQDNGKTWTNICSSTTTPGDSTGTVITGADGKSAYQIWLDAGNTGTEEDFLNSLKGADGTPGSDGANGKSAYQIWLDAGNTGTEEDFLNSLKGKDGTDGSGAGTGADGKSAYQIWLDAGNAGTEQDFLDSLKGADGTPGSDGANGKSAYQIWLDAGNTGTEEDFLNSLKGTDGAPGTTSWSNIEDKPFESIDNSTLNANEGVLKVNEESMKSYIDTEILGGAS